MSLVLLSSSHLQSLLDAEIFTLGLLLSFQRGRHRLHGTGAVLPGVVELLLLLSHTPINLLLDLSKLKLSAEDLVLLLLEGALGLLKGALELLLLLLEATPLLVQIMDGAATLTKLIQKILDLISEVLEKLSFIWILMESLKISPCSRA